MKQQLIRLVLAGVYGAAAASAVDAETLTRTTAFEYDPATGLVIREVIEPDDSALCLVTTYTYDAYGNRATATTRNCNGTSSGGLVEAAAPTGNPVFQSRTKTTAFTAGTQTVGGTLSWSAGQFPTTNTNALGHQETKEYDPRFGTVTKLTGPNGLATSWSYDGFGRKATETRSDGTSSSWTYTICGACPTHGKYFVTQTSSGAPTKTAYFDSLNREIRAATQGFDGTLVHKDTEYDSLGRVLRVSKPYYAGATPVWTSYEYDPLGRVTRVDEPSTSAGLTRTRTAYNGLVTIVEVSNADNGGNMPNGTKQTRTTTKSSQGSVTQVADTQGNTVTYTYDPLGNLKTTNAGGVITTLGYDGRGRKILMADPDMGTVEYAYNAMGELVWQKDAKLQITTIEYDRLGRLTKRTEADLVSNWFYDTYQGGGACNKGIGKLCQVSAANNYGRIVTYDAQGRVSSLSTTVDVAHTVSYTYDSSGRLDTTTYPTGFAVQNVYNARGYLWKVQRVNDPDTTVYWTASNVNAAGQVASELLGNGLTTIRTYDALSRMTAVQSGTVHNLAYSFDAIGNVIQRIDNVQAISENFIYDTLNRLLVASGSGLTTRSFAYNAIGNMTSKSDVGTYTYPTVGSARPHAVSSVTNSGAANSITASYGYDANGSLISASGTIYPGTGSVSFSRTLTYTSFNMPATVNQTQGSLSYGYTYTYSAEHERVRLVTVRPDDTLTSIYLHPVGKGALLYEKETRQSDGRIEHKHYVNGGSGLVGVFVSKSAYGAGDGPQMRYYHRDHLGSVAVITNSSGAQLERLAYEAFGERRSPNGTAQDRASPLIGITTDRGFTAHEHLDELNLIHMNGRIYDPAIARFMTADPFVQHVDNLQSYNRYSYVLNNPLMYTDPSGYFSLKKWFKATVKAIFIPTPRNIMHAVREQPLQEQFDKIVMKNPLLYAVGQGVAGYFTAFCGGCGAAAWSMYYTELATGSSNAAVRAGAITWASSYASSQIGLADAPGAAKIAAQGIVGGLSAELQGGSFEKGFLMSAAVTAAGLAFQEMKVATNQRAELAAWNDYREVPTLNGETWSYGIRGCDGSQCTGLLDFMHMGNESAMSAPFGCSASICMSIGNAISKVHDYMSHFSYSDVTGKSVGLGTFGNTVLDVWSFATMPPAAAFAGFAHMDPAAAVSWTNPPRRRTDDR